MCYRGTADQKHSEKLVDGSIKTAVPNVLLVDAASTCHEDTTVQAINREDLEAIYCNCRQQLFTCALVITRSPERAEDAVHEAFCRLWKQNQRPSDLKAYVFRAVRNAAIDQLRRRPISDELLPDFIFDPQMPPDELAEATEFKRQVVERLLTLSDDERETIVQHLYGELTFQQIADIRGTALGTVTSWYRRGLEKLRGKLEVVDGSV